MNKNTKQEGITQIHASYLICEDLKLELKNLESKFAKLVDKKSEHEKQINNFNNIYMLRFGDLIKEILELRASIYGKRNQYSQRKIAMEALEELREKIIQQLKDLPQSLNADEYQQLKTAYHKASRLCHPDKLAEDAKAKGEEIFKVLNEAYRNQDLNKVCRILLELEAENTSLVEASECIDDKAALQQKIASLYEQIATLEAEIKLLQETEVYQRIQAIIDMDSYFFEIEQELRGELKILKDEAFEY